MSHNFSQFSWSKILFNRRLIVTYILISTLLFLIRTLIFAGNYGGIEHDSGWYLGVAKNLAHRGIYASYTNTITQEGIGPFPSIHGRFSVQDKEGFSYFPAGVTAGPGYVLPEAFLLKIFGDGWWQYRLWPLLTYTGLLLTLFYLVWKLGGWWALVIFQIWVWVMPQIFIGFSFEAFSEHIALFYLLISLLLFYKGLDISKLEISNEIMKKSYLYLAGAGLLFSFSILTKSLFALSGAAFVPFLLGLILNHRKNLKEVLARESAFLMAFFLPIISFEVYRYLVLTSQFGIAGWEAINQDIKLHTNTAGSGFSVLTSSQIDWSFAARKMEAWIYTGIYNWNLAWIFFSLVPIIAWKLAPKQSQILQLLLFLAAFVPFIWFVFICPLDWGRRIFNSLVISMMLFSIIIGLLASYKGKFNIYQIAAAVLAIVFILPITQLDKTEAKLFLDQSTVDKWQIHRFEKGMQGFPSLPIFSLTDQQQVIDFFAENISKEDRVYYDGWFIMTELSTLTDKVFYPLDRYKNNNYRNPEGGLSFLVFGPYQKGRLKVVPEDYLNDKTLEYCSRVLFSNPSYQLCLLKF